MINSVRAVQTYKYSFLLALLIGAAFVSSAYPQDFTFSKFVADTLVINLPEDSTLTAPELPLQVRDDRETPGPMLGIRQIKKWKYVPVDQYLVLPESLSAALGRRLPVDTTRLGDTLVIDNISLWYDGSPLFLKGWTLNGCTRLTDGKGTTIREWQWEHRVKKKRKQKTEKAIGRLVGEWMAAQGEALNEDTSVRETSPYRYRRQLLFRVDTIILPDGYILDGHLSLDFPADQMETYIRGAPGMEIYYRKSSRHESIAVGCKQQQWLMRLRPSWLGWLNFSFRVGGNSYNPDKFDYVKWWNILLVNFGLTAAVEYRPPYYKGLFAGIGLHQSLNLMPGFIRVMSLVTDFLPGFHASIPPLSEVIPRYETGLLLTVGVVLP